MTTRPLRPVLTASIRIAFFVSRQTVSVPTIRLNTRTGAMRVSTPETTAFDLVRRPAAAGHLDQVATVLVELAERISPSELKSVAAFYQRTDVQRLGYLFDLVGAHSCADALSELLPELLPRLTPLRPGFDGRVFNENRRFGLAVNHRVEVDL